MKARNLNQAYRLVWSEVHQAFIAVAEFSRSSGKRSGKAAVVLATASLVVAAGVADAVELPTGGQIVAGSGAISQSGSTLTVTQTSGKMAADWQSFSIGQGHTVNFIQPSASAVALNRVLGSNVSVIQGALNANGHVFLVNPNGVLFTPTAQVNVGGLVASTLNISADDFLAGNYRFSASSTAGVKNEGHITTAHGGTVALIAARIENTGSITAPQGKVLMGAGSTVRLDLGGPVKIEVQEGALNTLIAQGGAIRADGGLVYLTAKAAGDLASSVINHTGITEARTLSTGERGEILLIGDMAHGAVQVGGMLNASAPSGGAGGFIETSAAIVQIADGVKVSTAAAHGTTGNWLIDPTDFTIASGLGVQTGSGIGATTLQNALSTTDVTIATSAIDTGGELGDINVNSAVSWSTNKLTLSAHNNININAMMDGGAAGKLSLRFGQATADGGSSTYNVNAPVNLAAGPNFSTQLGSTGPLKNYTVITALGAQGSTSGTDLQGINGGLAANYVLGSNIDASATAGWDAGAGFVPITLFSGTFDGVGHFITNLTIDRQFPEYVGLFGALGVGAIVQNLGLINSNISGSGRVGPLAGSNEGTVSTSYATGSTRAGTYAGGLVGLNGPHGVIQKSYSTGSLYVDNRGGGLVGVNEGRVSDSYSLVSVNDGNPDFFGGLVGLNTGTIERSYAAGVFVNVNNENAGSLVGYNGGAVTNSYWNKDVNSGYQGIGAGYVSGAAGLTTVEMKTASQFDGFDFVTPTTWGFAGSANNGYPVLGAFGGWTEQVITVYINPFTGSSVYGSTPVISYSFVDVIGELYSLTNATVSGTAIYGSAPTSSSNAGSYTFSYDSGLILGGTDASKYVLMAWTTPTTWTVNKADAVVTANSDNTKVYNGASQSVTDFSVAGLVNGETASVLTGVTAGATGTNAGNYTSTASGTAGNYNLSFVDGTLTISQRPITVTADNQSKVYGNADPLLTYAVTSGSLVSGDNLSGVLTRAEGEAVGSYTINASALANGNYLITANNGTLTISLQLNSTPLTAAITSASQASTQAVSAGFVAGDTVLRPNGSSSPASVVLASGASSGGLAWVDVADAPSGQSARVQNTNGFMPVFVVRGGINMGDNRDEQ